MGTKTDEAQKLANKAMAHVLAAIRNVEAIEKIVCTANDIEAMKAADRVIIAIRQAKLVGEEANGQFGVQIKGGST